MLTNIQQGHANLFTYLQSGKLKKSEFVRDWQHSRKVQLLCVQQSAKYKSASKTFHHGLDLDLQVCFMR